VYLYPLSFFFFVGNNGIVRDWFEFVVMNCDQSSSSNKEVLLHPLLSPLLSRSYCPISFSLCQENYCRFMKITAVHAV